MKQIFDEPLMEVINFSIYDDIVTDSTDEEEDTVEATIIE